MDKDILTTTEVAELLGISVRTAQLLVEDESLNSWKTPGGHRRVNRADVLAWKEKNNPAAPTSSACIFLHTSTEEQPRLLKSMSELNGYSFSAFHDSHRLSVAIGTSIPAVLIVDIREKTKERLQLIRSLVDDVDLKLMKIIVLVANEAASSGMPQAGKVIIVTKPSHLAGTIRSVLNSKVPVAPILGEISYPIGANEAQRLLAVERSGLVDTTAEDIFDRITWLTSHSLGTPVALFTLLTADRQWFKSRRGLPMEQIPRDWAFCNHTILQDKVFVVDDLKRNPHFLKHPAVVGDPHLRFYAGARVLDSAGFALGSLCVMDYSPRVLDRDQTQTLLALSRFTSDAIQLKGVTRQLHWTLDAVRRNREGASPRRR